MNTETPELIPLDAPALVEASAGTGKTHAITTYFVRKILEDGLTPEQILVVTYTKAATAELRVRTRGRIVEALALLGGAPAEPDALAEVVGNAVAARGDRAVERTLRAALSQMDQAPILTIHGFCQRLLQEHPLSFGIDLGLEVAEDISTLHTDLAVDFWAAELYDEPEWLLRALRDRGVTVRQLAKLANVATMPGVEIIGPPPQAIDGGALREVLRLHRETAALWFEQRSAILDVLAFEGLFGSIYKADTIQKTWTPGLDGLFRRATFEKLPKYFKWLCSTGITQKTKKQYDPPSHPFFDACEELQSAHEAIRPMLDYAVFSFRKRFCEFVRERSRERREQTARFSYDDLLTTVHAGVVASDEVAATVRKKYPFALVDEFQDTDSVQYAIFRAIYGQAAAVYVGDPKQAIYAFRGADVYSYLDAVDDIGQHGHRLGTNRRSDPGVVRAVNALFSRLDPPFLIDRIGFDPAHPHEPENRSTLTPPLEIVFLEGETLDGPTATCVAPIVANEVALLLESRERIGELRIEPGDIAVLCRSNNQAIAVTKALRALNVPTSLDGDSSVLNTEIAADLWAVLEAALMPADSRAVRRALLTSLVGVSAPALAAMNEDDETWSQWVSQFRDWHEAWHEQGVLRFLEMMLSYTEAEITIASRPTARRELTDLSHLQELLLRGERARRRDPVALMQWFRRLNDGTPDEGMVAIEDLQQRPDAEAGAVRVTTIHKSKGLEYGVVFCPFTWNDASLWDFERTAVKFHDDDGALKVDLGSPDFEEHLEESKREAASEALRVLYVAVTRAKHQCTLFWGPGYRWKDSALAGLLHGPETAKLSEDEMRADVEELANAAGEDVGVRPPRQERAMPRHDGETKLQLAARPRTRTFEQTARIASFTSLTGHDDKAPGPSASVTTSPLFADLPGGARTGLLLHAIFERAELDAIEDEGARSMIETQLGLHGFDPALTAHVQEDVAVVASAPMGGGLPALRDLKRSEVLRELEFSLAVERPALRELAELLEEHGAPASAPRYHERLLKVGDHTLRGFLRGFIDLMFEFEGRWYVADYKSNRLAAYEQPDVIEAVQRDHYVLQGALYSAAAHRYLHQRIKDYDPAKHWGGALFLFVRGMVGSSGGSSVFIDKQSPELLAAMDAWLGGSDGAR
jgi:exodeoxyribonuclease V beta subunit